MTEITANSELREPIKPIAFVAALILAPLVFAAPFFALLLLASTAPSGGGAGLFIFAIPVFAVFFGAIPYLLLGTPAFVLALRKRFSTAGAAFIANAAAYPVTFAYFAVTDRTGSADGFAGFIFAFGCVFAPIWGGIFGALYRKFTSI